MTGKGSRKKGMPSNHDGMSFLRGPLWVHVSWGQYFSDAKLFIGKLFQYRDLMTINNL